VTRGKITAPATYRNGAVTKFLSGFIPVYDIRRIRRMVKNNLFYHTHRQARVRYLLFRLASHLFFYWTIIIY
jgi:hypothetical protein